MELSLPRETLFEWEEIMAIDPPPGVNSTDNSLKRTGQALRYEYPNISQQKVSHVRFDCQARDSEWTVKGELSGMDSILYPYYGDIDSGTLQAGNLSVMGDAMGAEMAIVERAADDTAAQHHPTRHVDYLSHEWQEEDIYASWKHVSSRRKALPHGRRLENASWRMWSRMRLNLEAVSPETIGWIKDCDVTWLYGPFQTGNVSSSGNLSHSTSTESLQSLSESPVRPILKKKHISEIMHQRSLSSASLKRTSTFPQTKRAAVSFATSAPMSRSSSYSSSISSYGPATPPLEKSVRFHEEVHQCIIVHASEDGEEHDDERIEKSFLKIDSKSEDVAANTYFKSWLSKTPPAEKKHLPMSSKQWKSIGPLPSAKLKCDKHSSNTTVERVDSRDLESQPRRLSSDLSPWIAHIESDDEEEDWVLPAFSGADLLLTPSPNFPNQEFISDDELFEAEMFGSIKFGSSINRATSEDRSSVGSTDSYDRRRDSSSPSLSEQSSRSDDPDDEELLSPKPTFFVHSSTFKPTWDHVEDDMEWWNNV